MNKSSRMFLLLVAAAHCLSVDSTPLEDPAAPVYRLPSTVAPRNYMLRLEPDLDNDMVSGIVIIEILTASSIGNITESMDSILLHLGAESLVNESAVILMDSVGLVIRDLSFYYNEEATTLKVSLPEGTAFALNRIYVISIPFTSPLYSEPMGLFSGYYNSSSKYVASAFRATFARNVFPCFDEPQFQVPLTLQVVRPPSYSVVFTTSLISSVNASDTGKMLDTFAPTKDISLSSLGLFMSEVSPISMGNFNVYSPDVYNISSTWETLASNIITQLGPFPSPINLIVLPDLLYTSFASLGLIFTTPEVYTGQVSSTLQWKALRQQLAEAFLQQYLAFTHTPQWWSDLWLSDSLAAYLAIKVLPELGLEDLQTTQIRSKSFNRDYVSCSGPVVIRSQVLPRLDIETAIVNQTIKNKGLGVLKMWENTLPEGLVTQATKQFINSNKTLTSTGDFLDILVKLIENSSTSYNATTFTQRLANWLYGDGNPIVKVKLLNNTQIILSQTSSCPNASTLWPISISYTSNRSTGWSTFRQNHWLVESNLTIPVNKSSWFIFNLENAPYRVDYNTSYPQILAALAAINSSSIPATVRASIQSDAMDLALSGSLDFATALMIMNNTQHEQVDWIPVVEAIDAIAKLIGSEQEGFTEFGMYVTTLFCPDLLAALDLLNSSTHTDQWLARSVLTPWLCRFNISNCQSAATSLGWQLLTGNITDIINPNDVDNIVCQGARYSASVTESVLAAYTNSSDLSDKRLLVMALSCAVNPESVQKVLNAINTDSFSSKSSQTRLLLADSVNSSVTFSARESRDILVGLASSVENADTLVAFITSQASSLVDKIGSGYLSDVIKTLGHQRINLTALQSPAVTGLSEYLLQSVEQSIVKANFLSSWWSSNEQAFESALPQETTSAPATTATTPATAPASNVTTASTPTTLTTAPASNVTTVRTTPNGTAPTTKGPDSSAGSALLPTDSRFLYAIVVALVTVLNVNM